MCFLLIYIWFLEDSDGSAADRRDSLPVDEWALLCSAYRPKTRWLYFVDNVGVFRSAGLLRWELLARINARAELLMELFVVNLIRF